MNTSWLRPWLRAAALYAVATVAATWPYALTLRSRLPSLVDPLQHLWLMRWYRACLAEGRLPLVCDEIQYPLGAPIGNFSPLHLQGLLFLGLNFFIDNDLLVYNILWLLGFVTTGLATYALARRLIEGEPAALLAGLLAMLSGPMMVHSHCHLELIYLGGFPLFLLAWMRFVDAPGATRLAAAVGALTLVALCAAYFLVFASLVGALYVAYRTFVEGRRGNPRWLIPRLGWLIAFAASCLPVLAGLFYPQAWSAASGRSLGRTRAEFDAFHLPWWTYFTPSPGHRLAEFLPFDPYAAAKVSGEGTGYLGVVCLALLVVARARRSPVKAGGFLWLALAVLAVLSIGSRLPWDGRPIGMPAGWLWDWYPPFRLIRVPPRMKFFVAVLAAVLAAGAYARLDARLRSRRLRATLFAATAAIAVLDLAHVGYPAAAVPSLPVGYTWLLERDPDAVWLEAPQMASGGAGEVNSLAMHWQSRHRGRTTAGYSGQIQWPLDNLVSWSSPFIHYRLSEPGYLSGPTETFDLVTEADPASYVWAYLTVHRLPYVVVHRWSGTGFSGLEKLRELLAPAKIYEDDLLAIYERDRLPAPDRPVVICTDGWHARAIPPLDGPVRPVGESARLVVYNPAEGEGVVLGLRARSFGRARRVTLQRGGRTVATWTLPRTDQTIVATPPLTLPRGFSTLALTCDGAIEPGPGGHRFDAVGGPIGLLVSGLNVSDPSAERAARGRPPADRETLR